MLISSFDCAFHYLHDTIQYNSKHEAMGEKNLNDKDILRLIERRENENDALKKILDGINSKSGEQDKKKYKLKKFKK